ncbi:hypothetical protein CPC08DRAFT_507436 [Agrocybe pediades]|nr:hypothetical protein CPC08DRAFT_507436 [Agrocybe pediades]
MVRMNTFIDGDHPSPMERRPIGEDVRNFLRQRRRGMCPTLARSSRNKRPIQFRISRIPTSPFSPYDHPPRPQTHRRSRVYHGCVGLVAQEKVTWLDVATLVHDSINLDSEACFEDGHTAHM